MRRSPQLLIAVIIVLVSMVSYCGNKTQNAYTGKVQHLAMTADQEVAIGLKAGPELLSQYGGESRDPKAKAKVEEVGERIVRAAVKSSPYRFQFHLLADNQTINAFALPDGQVFITEALLRRLHTEGELAGVLGHEIGHVVGRHAAQQLAKQQLAQGVAGAVTVATYDRDDPNRAATTSQIARMATSMLTLKYGRNDELEADALGVRFLAEAGYDPRAMVGVMETLKAAGGRQGAEFFSTHPNPDHRLERIKGEIEQQFPNGLPTGLQP